MTEQFGAIPVRAFGDTRLSAADFRVMGAIAYFDRLGRNGTGCYVDPRKLGELASVDYTHINRHTRRLYDLGYLSIGRSATDRRKRVYSLIYNEDQAVVANSGYNQDRGVIQVPLDDHDGEKVANSGDILPEKVANPNSQAVDPKAISHPKRSCKTYLRNSTKQVVSVGRGGSMRGGNHFAFSAPIARQGDRGSGNSQAQGHFMLPIRGGNQQTRNQRSEPDWKGWADWIGLSRGMTTEQAWNWLLEEITRIATEKDINSTEAGWLLDRQLKKRRKAAA